MDANHQSLVLLNLNIVFSEISHYYRCLFTSVALAQKSIFYAISQVFEFVNSIYDEQTKT